MKKVLLLLYIALAFSGYSQTNFRFADSTAQWNVLSAQPRMTPPLGYYYNSYILKVLRDTILHNEKYQAIQYNTAFTNPLQSFGKFYIRKDSSQRVYGKINADSAEYLIYDFSKQAGDSFSIGVPYSWPYIIHIHVDSVSTVLWKYSRKVQYVTTDAFVPHNDVFVEGIGSLRSFFAFPGVIYSPLDGADYSLLCYFENDTLVYHDTLYSNCTVDSTWLGINETQKAEVKLSPNPATTYLTIQLQQSLTSATVFQLYDITGRMILQKPLTAQTNRIELSGVSKGMYLYSVVSEQQRVGAGKVVVE